MAFCSKCGTQLSDGAKFCPKCGNPTGSTQKESSSTDKDDSPKGIIDAFKEGWKEGVNESGNESNENGGELTTAQKVIHGVLATIAFLSIFGTIGDGMWFAAIVCVAVLIASCYVFIEKQHVWTTAICGFLLLTLAVGATAPDEEKGKQTQTEQKQESPAEKAAREKREKEERQKDKINEIERRAEREGRILAQSVRYTDSWPKHCQNSYISAFGTPSTDEDYKMYDVFKEAFRKSYFATLDAQQKMN